MGQHSKKLISCMVVFLIPSMVITLFLFSTSVKAAVLGSKYYYLSLERDNFKDLKQQFINDFKGNKLSEFSYDCKVNAKIDGDQMKTDPEMALIADYISKFELNLKYNANNKDLRNSYYTSLICAKYEGKEFANVDIKSADNKTLVAFPGLTEKTLGIESYNTMYIKYIEAYLGDDKAFQEVFGLTREAYEKMTERYLKDIIFSQIPDKNVMFNSEANFENINCNSITFNIDQNIISDIYKALAKELENDKNARIVLSSIINSAMASTYLNQGLSVEKITQEEIDEIIKKLCGELNEAAEDVGEVKLVYTAYFKDNGDIISRQLNDKLSDTSITFSMFKDLSGTDIFDFSIKENQMSIFKLENTAKLNSGIYNGNFNVYLSDKSLLEAKYSYEKDAKIGNLRAFIGEIEGKVNLEQFNNSSDYNEINNIYFNFINKKKDNDTLEGKTTITSMVKSKRMSARIFTEVNQSNVANITKPKVSIENSIKLTDYLEFSEMMEEINQNIQIRLLELIF